MPRVSQIRWRDADKAELAKRVRNFNAKRTRLIKLVPELVDILPPKASVAEIKSNIYSRSDFNKQINSLKRFMEKGMEDTVTTEQGVVTTKYQLNELQIQKKSINAKRAQTIKKQQPSTYKGTMGSINKRNLRPLKTDFQKVSKEMWDTIVNKMNRQYMDKYYNDSDERYKENYLRSLKNAYEGLDGFEEMYNRVEDMTAEDVVAMYYYDPNLQTDFNYPVDREEAQQNFTFVVDSFNNYLEKMDL